MNIMTMKFVKCIPLLMMALFLYSCTEDGTGGIGGGGGIVTGTPPSINAGSGGDLVDGSATINNGSTFKVSVDAQAGDNPLNALAIYQNGNVVDPSRILLNGAAIGNNPSVLFGNDKTSFAADIEITHESSGSSDSYEVAVVDEVNNNSSVFYTINTPQNPPTVSASISSEVNAMVGEILSIPVTASPGGASLAFLVVNEGANYPTENVYYDDLNNPLGANPYPLPNSDHNGFDRNIFIRLPNTPGTYEYQILIIDANELANDPIIFSVNVTPSGTPITSGSDLIGILLNQAGPAGQGGLDLDTGNGSLGSTAADAEIRDMGIDTDLPFADNWLQRIAGTNNTEVKHVYPGQGVSENFSFDNVQFKEEIESAFMSGTNFMEQIGSVPVSQRILGGELFAASRNGQTYLFRIREINVTTTDNQDNYVIDIKF